MDAGPPHGSSGQVDLPNPAGSGPRRALHDALQQLSPPLASIYLGALKAGASDRNPDRLPQAAHSLRELMNGMPGALGVPVGELNQRLGDRLSGLRGSWGSLGALGADPDRAWRGEISGPLRKFLKRATGFFAWYDEHQPRRRAEFGDTLDRLSPSPRAVPQQLHANNVVAWMAMRQYFIDVCHHSTQTEVSTFDATLEQLEGFLLDRLRPRTFEDFDEIDAIIREGEAGSSP